MQDQRPQVVVEMSCQFSVLDLCIDTTSGGIWMIYIHTNYHYFLPLNSYTHYFTLKKLAFCLKITRE